MPCGRRLVLVSAAAVFVSALSAAAAMPGGQSEDRFAALQRWLIDVNEHRPGHRDAAAERLGAWKNSELDAITPYIETLAHLLSDPGNPNAGPRFRSIDEREITQLRQLARAEAARGDVNRILKRAAMLHADVMMSGAAPQMARLSARDAASEARRGGQLAVRGLDGEYDGFVVIPHHWSVGRMLLDAVYPDPASDEFVRLWYRATTAYMLQRAHLGEAERHLRHARERLTPDAGVHLDSGSLYEAYASERAQSMMSSSQERGVRFEVRSAAGNLTLAEMHFKQATVLDPKVIEARVRLSRVRIALGRPEEGVADLEAASIAANDPVVRYYAVLFLGQAQEALGRIDAARAAYQRAASLYPMSQAPHLALSLLAREAGDRETAQSSLGSYFQAASAQRIRYDPWWVYYMGNGRNMRALVLKLWESVPGPDTP